MDHTIPQSKFDIPSGKKKTKKSLPGSQHIVTTLGIANRNRTELKNEQSSTKQVLSKHKKKEEPKKTEANIENNNATEQGSPEPARGRDLPPALATGHADAKDDGEIEGEAEHLSGDDYSI